MDGEPFDTIGQMFGVYSSTRGRVFICCVSGRHTVMITDVRKTSTSDEPRYTNLFVPARCGWCEGPTAPNEHPGEAGKPLGLHSDVIRGWRVFKAIEGWCRDGVSSVHPVTDPLAIIGVCGRYTATMQTVQVVTGEGGSPSLEILPYVDPSFIPCRCV